jgi:hypothetical protein
VTELAMLGGIVFYYVAAAYLDSIYQERARMQARNRSPYPDIWFIGELFPGRKVDKKEKVDWQHEGF